MSSSEHSSSESDETGNESLPDLYKLKPYDLEPRISSSDLSSSSNGNSDSETAEESRIERRLVFVWEMSSNGFIREYLLF